MTRNEFLKIATQIKTDKHFSWQYLADQLELLLSPEEIDKNIHHILANSENPLAKEALELLCKKVTDTHERDRDLFLLISGHPQLRNLVGNRMRTNGIIEGEKNKGGRLSLTTEEKKEILKKYNVLMRNNGMTHEEALKQLKISERTFYNYKKDVTAINSVQG